MKRRPPSFGTARHPLAAHVLLQPWARFTQGQLHTAVTGGAPLRLDTSGGLRRPISMSGRHGKTPTVHGRREHCVTSIYTPHVVRALWWYVLKRPGAGWTSSRTVPRRWDEPAVSAAFFAESGSRRIAPRAHRLLTGMQVPSVL